MSDSTSALARRRMLSHFYRAGGLLSFFAVGRFGKARTATFNECLTAGFIKRTLTGYALTDAGRLEARR